jgi:hypothetical protein
MSHCWGRDFPTQGCPKVHPSTVRTIGLAIADIVNDLHDNLFFAALSTLAGKVELHRETCRKVIRYFCEVGVLEVVKLPHPGSGDPGVYRWIWRPPVDNAESPRGGRERFATSHQDKRHNRRSEVAKDSRGVANMFARGSRTDSRHNPIDTQLNNAREPDNACTVCGGFGWKNFEEESRSWERCNCRSASARGRP